jgi:hypothetical protein
MSMSGQRKAIGGMALSSRDVLYREGLLGKETSGKLFSFPGSSKQSGGWGGVLKGE